MIVGDTRKASPDGKHVGEVAWRQLCMTLENPFFSGVLFPADTPVSNKWFTDGSRIADGEFGG